MLMLFLVVIVCILTCIAFSGIISIIRYPSGFDIGTLILFALWGWSVYVLYDQFVANIAITLK